jgi:hypothetical protein
MISMNLIRVNKYERQTTVKSHRPWLFALFILSLFILSTSQAQDLETIKDQKLVQVSGGVGLNTTFYDAQGIPNRRDPFYWMLNANLNFNFLNVIQAPFSMTLSQQDKRFSQPQPFNRFGISPRYKMVTAHFGHRAMSFSEYTLAGNMFLGAGVEVVPKGSFVRVSAMYGRLSKAVEKSAQQGLVFAKPTFRRMGYGMKIGLGRDKNMVDLIFFRAWDDESSIPVTDSLEVTPEENLVMAVHTKNQLGERVAVEIEYAYSLFTRDKRSVETESQSYSFTNNLGGLFKPNLSSEFNNAFTTTLNYNGEWYQANLKYRKVDPGYRTLGSAFLNNGLKDLTGGLSWNMFHQKVNLSTNAGVQQSTKENSVVRVIYAFNLNYNASQRLSLNSSYSNFSTTTRQTQLQRSKLVDSLEYFQVTKSYSANVNYKLGNENNPKTLLLAASMQDATDNKGTASTFYTLSVGEQMKLAKQWQLTISGCYNKNLSAAQENTSVGPVMNLNRAFLEGKIRSAFSMALLNSYLSNELKNQVTNVSVTNSLRVAKKHSFAVNIYYLKNKETGEEGKEFSEIRAMFNYNYSF